ncbi:hypothetical protein [Tardiphaga sp.]|uniref:hypothetical protein n=1 Tax=Tardiphaga sp. TaxID=1926292 RepID=UPI00352A0279
MHRARLRPGRREDHDDHPGHVRRDHVRQDHVYQGHRGDLTEAYLPQAVCQARPEQPKARVLQQEASLQAGMPQVALPLRVAWQALEPVLAQWQALAARRAVSSLRAVSLVLRPGVVRAAWDVRRPAALRRVRGAQGVLRRARDVRDAQRAASALMEPQAQRWVQAVRRAGPEGRREPVAELGAAAERPQVVGVAAVPGAEVQPQAAAQQEVPEARDAQQGERLVAVQRGVRPAARQRAEQPQGEPWAAPSGEPWVLPWAHLQAQQVRPARPRSAHRHSTHKQHSLRYAQRRALSWPAIRDEVLS